MRSPTVMLASLVLTVACSQPCEDFGGERPSEWAGHADIIAPGGTMCSAGPNFAHVDYETESNPYVVVVQHLEGRGWERVRSRPDHELQMVFLTRGEEHLAVSIERVNGTYSRAEYRLDAF